MHLLSIFCGDVKSNPGLGTGKNVQIIYPNILGFHANLDRLAEAGLDCDVLVCARLKSLIGTISQSSISLALAAQN